MRKNKLLYEIKNLRGVVMFGAETLIVVYKDELLANQLKKLVETKDDIKDGEVVGTTDMSVNIVSWTEKVWLTNKKAGNIKDKVLYLGDIKGTDKLIPIIDVKFDDCGVKFGWAGNQAIVYADTTAMRNRDDYLTFIEKLSSLPVPEMIKEAKNVSINEGASEESAESSSQDIPTEETEEKKSSTFFNKVKGTLSKGIDAMGKLGTKAAMKSEDLLRGNNTVKQQMLFYGVVNLYNHGLEEFINK